VTRRTVGLRWRLASTAAVLIVVPILLLSVYTLYQARLLYLRGIDEQMTAEARVIGVVVAPLVMEHPADIEATAKQMGASAGNRVTVIRSDGVVLADSQEDPGRMENHALRPEVVEAISGGHGSSLRHSETIGTDLLYVAVPIGPEGRPTAIIRVARPLEQIYAAIDRMRNVITLGAVLAGSISVALAVLFADRTARPIQHLTMMAKEFASGTFNRRTSHGTWGEVADLNAAFNSMAQELHETISQLASEHAKLTAILEAPADGLVMVDEARTVITMNPAAVRLLQMSVKDTVIGRPLIEVVRDHEIDGLLRDALASGKRSERFLERHRPQRFLRAIAAPVTAGSARLGLLVMQDLTELRRLETARRDFVANISHELHTPLASVKALVETLEDGAIDDTTVAKRFLHQVDVEVDRLTQLVRELMELSRIESGQVVLQRQVVPVETLVDTPVARLRTQVERAELTMCVEAVDALPDVVADPARIEQVLVNLLHNAVKFTPPGGTITVSGRAVGQMVELSVTDTGIGIAPADLPRIFERFYKADKARSGGGTGLGLAIAKHIIKSHGGMVRAQNNPGRGATFTITLPTAHASVTTDPAPSFSLIN